MHDPPSEICTTVCIRVFLTKQTTIYIYILLQPSIRDVVNNLAQAP